MNRPQNDGPAERAITLMKFADSWVGQGNDASYASNTLNTGNYPSLSCKDLIDSDLNFPGPSKQSYSRISITLPLSGATLASTCGKKSMPCTFSP
jgi:hypothetical protein